MHDRFCRYQPVERDLAWEGVPKSVPGGLSDILDVAADPFLCGGSMRSRTGVVFLVLAPLAGALLVAAPAAWADSSGVVLAQQPNEDTEGAGADAQDPDEGAGQDDPDAETGANEGQTEEGTSAEAGPPWTYQMARITLALLVFLALGLGYLYFRLITRRRRGEV